MSLSNIEDFLKLEYSVIIHRRNNSFLLHLPDLHLFTENESLAVAYDNLELAKRNLIDSFFAIGNSEKIPLPKYIAEKQDLKKSLTPFFIKLGAFAVTGVLLISAANISFNYSLQQGPKILAQRAGKAAVNDFGATLDKVVRREFTPEKEERIRLGIRKLVAALKPFMNEFEPLHLE